MFRFYNKTHIEYYGKFIAEKPFVSHELIERCVQKNDYREYLYETLKFVGVFVSKVSCIDPKVSDVKEISEIRRPF